MSTQNDEIHAAKSAFDKWTNTQGWDQWDYELQQFSAEDVMDFATQYAASRISELEAENKRLREKIAYQQIEIIKLTGDLEERSWIPVTESLPEEVAQNVLVHLSDGTILTGRLWANGWSAFFSDGECEVTEREVTHWLPLPPQPPKEQ